jgi:parallel beta-helix repeat protein
MKSNRNIIFVLLISVIFLASITKIKPYFNSNRAESSLNFEIQIELKIKSASYREILGSPIFIDDSDPNSNWDKMVIENSWCSGKGSWSDPYVIANISVDSHDLGNCIEIRNSNAYFLIVDCKLQNSITTPSYGGLGLINTNNGLVMNNIISGNMFGIYVSGCNNNTIAKNTIDNDHGGLSLSNSHNNTVSDNIIKSFYEGIELYYSQYNTIYNNKVKDSVYGIDLQCNYNNVSGNRVINSIYGITLNGNNNYLSGNVMEDCGLYLTGSLEDVITNTIESTNNVSGKPLYFYSNKNSLEVLDLINAGQILLVNCSNFVLSNLTVASGTCGISLLYCRNLTISNCETSFNKRWGIFLYRSDKNTINGSTANTISYESEIGFLIQNSGIVLIKSNTNIVQSNIASSNREKGIILSESNDNLIAGNVINGNAQGIYMYESTSNNVTENYIYNNKGFYGDDAGIFLSRSSNNDISSNIIWDNARGLTIYSNSHTNIVSGNTISNNYMGILVERADGNVIVGNNLSNNQIGIDLKDCSESLVYSNCFNNGYNAYDSGSDNHWDKRRSGNYWSDYTGQDIDGNGIGNSPYLINGPAASKDNFPLIEWGGLFVETEYPNNWIQIPGYNLFVMLGLLSVVVIFVFQRLKTSKKTSPLSLFK